MSSRNNILETSIAAVIASVQGQKLVAPVDVMNTLNHSWPYCKGVFKLTNQNNDYNSRKATTVSVFTGGQVVTQLILQDRFQPLFARHKNDKVAYSDLPTLAQIKQIELRMGNQIVEHIQPEVLYSRLYEKYEKNWKYITTNWLGGSAEYPEDSPLQVYEGFKGARFDETRHERNVIKPEYNWLLPVELCLFRNRDRFKFLLSKESPIEIIVHFNNLQSFTHRSDNFPNFELQGTLDVHVMFAYPVDWKLYLNNLPYIDSSLFDTSVTPYRFQNLTHIMNEKKFPLNTDLKLAVQPVPTHAMRMYVKNNIFMDGAVRFFGHSVSKSVENWIASHIIPTTLQTSIGSTLNLNTGLFTTGNATAGPWTVQNFAPTTNHFTLQYVKNTSVSYFIEVHSTINFDILKDIYLDLDCFLSDTRLTKPQFYYLKQFRLNILPFNAADTSFANAEDVTVPQHNSAIKYVNGFFTFIGNDSNKYVFKSVDNIERSDWIDDFSYSCIFSHPVPVTNNTASVYAAKEYVSLSHYLFWKWFDLDRKYPIEMERISLETLAGGQINQDRTELELMKDFEVKRPIFWYTLDLTFSYKDHTLNLDTYGYWQMASSNAFNSFTPYFRERHIMFDDAIISDIWKEMQTASYTIRLAAIQETSSILKYNDDLSLRVVGEQELKIVNEEIQSEILQKELDWYNPEMVRGTEYPLRTRSGPKRQRVSNDRFSANNFALLDEEQEEYMRRKQARPGVAGRF